MTTTFAPHFLNTILSVLLETKDVTSARQTGNKWLA